MGTHVHTHPNSLHINIKVIKYNGKKLYLDGYIKR